MSIEDILKDMPLDDAAKTRLSEAWTTALSDAAIAQEGQLREELSARYEDDLAKIQESFGIFLEERIAPHVEELQEGVSAVDQMKSNYAAKLAKVNESARRSVQKKLGALEQVMETTMRAELTELHADVVASRKAALQSITEKRSELDKEGVVFRATAARVLENIINVKVPKELAELREDIEAARRDSFGRDVYEAFATTFRHQFFNSSSEFKKLAEENTGLQEEVKMTKLKAAKKIRESEATAKAETAARVKLQESVVRSRTMAKLLRNLDGTSKVQMKALLEATATNKLEATYRKAIPQIVKEAKRPAPRRVVNEGKTNVRNVQFHSGGGKPALTEDATYDQFDDELLDMKRRAGNATNR